MVACHQARLEEPLLALVERGEGAPQRLAGRLSQRGDPARGLPRAPDIETCGGIPQLVAFRIAGAFSLGGVEVVPVALLHGPLPVLGFRIGSFAYLTDCNLIPDESWPLLDGVRTVIIDALRHRPHPTHFTVAEAVDVVARLGAERAYFTHICHDLPHAATCARLPPGVELAYDGLILEVE